MTTEIDVNKEAFTELQAHLSSAMTAVFDLKHLYSDNNWKYLTRTAREKRIKPLLDALGGAEDTAKAILKALRAVKRARIRDDELLSELIAMHGLPVDELKDKLGSALETSEDE